MQNLGGGVGGSGGNLITGPNGNPWYNEGFPDQIGTAYVATAPAQLDLANTLNAGAALSGGLNFAWSMNYSNPGNLYTKNATITDTLPPNTTLDTSDSTAEWQSIGGTTYTYAIGALDASASGSVTIAASYSTPPAGGTQITNSAFITDDQSNGFDANPNNNSANTISVSPTPTPTPAAIAGLAFHLFPAVGMNSGSLQNLTTARWMATSMSVPGEQDSGDYASGRSRMTLRQSCAYAQRCRSWPGWKYLFR